MIFVVELVMSWSDVCFGSQDGSVISPSGNSCHGPVDSKVNPQIMPQNGTVHGKLNVAGSCSFCHPVLSLHTWHFHVPLLTVQFCNTILAQSVNYLPVLQLDTYSLHQCFANASHNELLHTPYSNYPETMQSPRWFQSMHGRVRESSHRLKENSEPKSGRSLQAPKLAQAQSPYHPIPPMPHPGSVWSAVRNPCPWEAQLSSKLEGHDHDKISRTCLACL